MQGDGNSYMPGQENRLEGECHNCRQHTAKLSLDGGKCSHRNQEQRRGNIAQRRRRGDTRVAAMTTLRGQQKSRSSYKKFYIHFFFFNSHPRVTFPLKIEAFLRESVQLYFQGYYHIMRLGQNYASFFFKQKRHLKGIKKRNDNKKSPLLTAPTDDCIYNALPYTTSHLALFFNIMYKTIYQYGRFEKYITTCIDQCSSVLLWCRVSYTTNYKTGSETVYNTCQLLSYEW